MCMLADENIAGWQVAQEAVKDKLELLLLLPSNL